MLQLHKSLWDVYEHFSYTCIIDGTEKQLILNFILHWLFISPYSGDGDGSGDGVVYVQYVTK